MSIRERRCETCRYWDSHSQDLLLGDCRAPGNHRYCRVPITNTEGKIVSHALLDSFGPEETKPNFVCGAWDDGEPSPPQPSKE